MTIYNKTIFRQADSRWGSLPYPTSSYKFAGNGCGCCAVTHCAIELENFKNYTPADVRKYMVQFATKGNGTLWNGITKGLENYGFNVHWRQADTMADIWKVLEKSLKKGVILFGSSKGGTKKITWTTGGHYVAFVDWKYENDDYWFYCKDSGGRKHDGWFSYRQHMAGDVRNVWICTSLKSGYKFIGASTTPTPTPSTSTTTVTKYATYSGAFPTKTIKKGSKGTNVTRWQKYLQWMGYNLKADGKFGGITRTKTIAAQKKLGFTGKAVDGIVGKNTIAKAKAYKKAYKVVVVVTPIPTPQAPTSTPSTTSDDLPKKCIDVSYWQGKISQANWEKIKKSCGYAICRASYTSQSKFSLGADSTFSTNFTNAKAVGLRVGAYHYSQAISVDEAKKEAEFLCNILKNYTPTFYVVCDFEYGGRLNSKIGKKASDIANAFCDVVKAHGYQPCIYANTSTLNNALTNPKYPVWVAQYNDTCTYKGAKVMWQYTSKGRVDGISASSTNSKSANVDLSHVYEVYPLQAQPIAPTPTPTTPIVVKPTSKYFNVLALPTLKKGSKGENVSDLQRFLNWYSSTFALKVDGDFGSLTEDAVKIFQKSEGITDDGIYGSQSFVKAYAYASNACKLLVEMKELSWAYGTAKSKYAYDSGSPTSICKTIMKKYGYDTKAKMSDCGNFVNSVVRESKVDTKFTSLHAVKTPFPTKEDKFDIVLSGKSIPSGFLKPADIIRYKKTNDSQHAMAYYGDGKVCDAGHYDRFGNIRADEKRYARSNVKTSTIQVLRVKE